MSRLFAFLSLTLMLSLLPTLPTKAAPSAASVEYLPLSFIPNVGQTDDAVRYQVQSLGGMLFFTANEVVLSLPSPSTEAPSKFDDFERDDQPLFGDTVLRLQFLGANPTPEMTATELLSGKVNYFIGNDSSQWHTDVSTYAGVVYHDLYSGVDLRYDGNEGLLKGTFTVAPYIDPQVINWRYGGAEAVIVDESSGDLHITLPGGNVLAERAPTAWQTIDEVNVPVQISYKVEADAKISFNLGAYNVAYPLVLDPVLQYSTFIGVSNEVTGYDITTDSDNNVYVTGFSQSSNYPLANAIQPYHAGLFCGKEQQGPCGDIIITKLNATGTSLLYSTYLGGTGYDVGLGIALDADRNIYVTGVTSSQNFPTTSGSFQPSYAGDACSSTSLCQDEALVFKLNASGNALLYASYLGGTLTDQANSIVLDEDGSAYIAGYTFSLDFPVLNAYQATHGGDVDAFVTKVSPDGSAIAYSTFIGGSSFERAMSIKIDGSDNFYIAGLTQSTDYPTTANAFQIAYHGGAFTGEAFLTRFNATGSSIIYSTFLGGISSDYANDLALDTSGNVYITGMADSSDFPTTSGAYDRTYNGANDGFVAKFNTGAAGSSSLIYSTFIGGGSTDEANAIAVDENNNAYVVGKTQSGNFPVLASVQNTYKLQGDGFVTRLNALGSSLVYSTYLGGMYQDNVLGITTASNITGISAYVTGRTASPDFPVSYNAYQPTGAGLYVSIIGPGADLSTTGSLTSNNVWIGNQLSYQWIVKNNGPDVAINTQLISNVPTNATFVGYTAGQGSCSYASGQISCSLGTLAVSASVTVIITIVPTESKQIVLTGTSSSNQTDLVLSNNSSSKSKNIMPLVNTEVDGDDLSCDVQNCSLREAINAANQMSGLDTVRFNIAGTGVHTIAPASGLPVITNPVTIDGTSQPGYAGVPLIEINGQSAGLANGLYITAGSSTVRGLIINRFIGAGILLQGSIGNAIVGNYIGTNWAGTVALGNRDGVYILDSNNNTIGGTTASNRNLISGNTDDGVNLEGVAATGNIVLGNWIGVQADGTSALGNGGDGVKISNSVGNTIGGGNIIAFNTRGIYVEQQAPNAIYNTFTTNSIFSNAGLGIELAGDGVSMNDAGDSDAGPNDLQNYPVLTDARDMGNTTIITGMFNGTPNANFRLEFFASDNCDVSGYGEGHTYLGFKTVATDANGDGVISVDLHMIGLVDQFVTAIATSSAGSTSEFSACVSVITDSALDSAPPRNYYTTNTPTLTWSAVSWAVGYWLQVDDSDQFTNPIVFQNANVPSSQLSIPANLPNQDGTYYWRVCALKTANTCGGWSAVDSFVVDVP